MERKIIHIEEDKCNGCGLCAAACHEGAIGMVDGKARLLRDDYCDGLGDCLPLCPTGAITFEVREAAEFSPRANMEGLTANRTGREAEQGYDAAAVAADMAAKQMPKTLGSNTPKPSPCAGNGAMPMEGGCPGSMARALRQPGVASAEAPGAPVASDATESELMQWPVQIKLAPVQAPHYEGARLLVAADCSAFAYRNFHADFMKGHITLIGCPKLDEGQWGGAVAKQPGGMNSTNAYSGGMEKLAAIIANNNIQSVTVARMEVPCCGGLENAVKQALQQSGKMIPWRVAVISTDGRLLDTGT